MHTYEIKTMLAHMVMKYDLQFPSGQCHPSNLEAGVDPVYWLTVQVLLKGWGRSRSILVDLKGLSFMRLPSHATQFGQPIRVLQRDLKEFTAVWIMRNSNGRIWGHIDYSLEDNFLDVLL